MADKILGLASFGTFYVILVDIASTVSDIEGKGFMP